MSLIQARWIGFAAAAAAALSAPVLLVQAEETAPPVPVPPPPAPEVTPRAPAPLSFAFTAPPFDPDRTPEGAALPADPAAASEAAPAPPPAALPRLVGIASRSRGRAVALVKGADGETVMLAPGRSVDGWRLVAIGRDQAVFELGGARQTARLDFSNKDGGAAAPVPTIPPPAPAPAEPAAPEPRN